MTEPTPQPEELLSAADRAAIDALFEPTTDNNNLTSETRARRDRASALLRLLDTPTSPADDTLVDVTMARVMRAARLAAVSQSPAEPELSDADREALDAWVQTGYDASRVPSSLRARAARHQNLAGLVTNMAADSTASLIDRTVAAVDQAREAHGGPYKFRGAWRSNFRMGDLVSIAALLLIAVSVVWPVMAGMRSQASKMACAGNLRDVASAMSAYAGSNKDQMPMATASLGGGRWWDVGSSSGSSNSSNLFTLARSGFASLASLACPGNPHAPRTVAAPGARDWSNLDEVSYSYQIMFGSARHTLQGDRAPVLADRSPVVLRAVRGQIIYPWENSTNHTGRGQEILYTDGSAQWLNTPTLKNGDNIWLPMVIEDALRQVAISRGLKLQGTETPAGADDVFLGP